MPAKLGPNIEMTVMTRNTEIPVSNFSCPVTSSIIAGATIMC